MYLELSLWLTSTTHINAIHIPDFFQKKKHFLNIFSCIILTAHAGILVSC